MTNPNPRTRSSIIEARRLSAIARAHGKARSDGLARRATKHGRRTLSVAEQKLRDAAIETLLLDGHNETCVARSFDLSRQRIHQMKQKRLGSDGACDRHCCQHPSHYFPMGPMRSPVPS